MFKLPDSLAASLSNHLAESLPLLSAAAAIQNSFHLASRPILHSDIKTKITAV